MLKVLGDRETTIARELTKLNEEYIEGKLSELVEIDESTLIGGMVIIIEGSQNVNEVDDEEILKRAKMLLEKNIRTKDVAEIVAFEFKINKNYVYDLIIKNKK